MTSKSRWWAGLSPSCAVCFVPFEAACGVWSIEGKSSKSSSGCRCRNPNNQRARSADAGTVQRMPSSEATSNSGSGTSGWGHLGQCEAGSGRDAREMERSTGRLTFAARLIFVAACNLQLTSFLSPMAHAPPPVRVGIFTSGTQTSWRHIAAESQICENERYQSPWCLRWNGELS